MIYVKLLGAICLLSLFSCEDTKPEDNRFVVGELAKSERVVISSFYSPPKGSNAPVKLNIGPSYPNQTLTLVFWPSDLAENFDTSFSPKDLLYEELNVTGIVSDYEGAKQIVIKEPKQIGGLGKKKRVGGSPQSDLNTQESELGSIVVSYNSPIGATISNKSNSNIGKALVNLIDSSQKTLDIAVYGFRDQIDLYEAIQKAIRRGVVVRLIVDRDTEGESYYSSTEEFVDLVKNVRDDYQVDLETEKMKRSQFAPYWPAPEGFKGPPQAIGYSINNEEALISVHASQEEFPFKGDIMHHKFAIADKSKVWTGSCNVSDSGTGGYNANVACVINSTSVAERFTNEFELMYKQGRFHRRKLDVTFNRSQKKYELKEGSVQIGFCPQDYVGRYLLQPRIRAAEKSIDIAIFFLTHKFITADLINAHQRGVKVRVIIDATAAGNGYTKHAILRAAGIPVKVENWGGKMHMKSCCIDNHYVVLGSMNWTSAGVRSNDENLILLNSPQEAKRFGDFYTQLWNSIPDICLTKDPDPESLASTGSTTDGVDNDFDELIDGDDPTGNKIAYNTAELPPIGVADLSKGFGYIRGVKYQLLLGVEDKKSKVYVLPNHPRYETLRNQKIRYFPSIQEAKEAGFEENITSQKR